MFYVFKLMNFQVDLIYEDSWKLSHSVVFAKINKLFNIIFCYLPLHLNHDVKESWNNQVIFRTHSLPFPFCKWENNIPREVKDLLEPQRYLAALN